MSDARTSYEPARPYGGIRALLSPQGSIWFVTSEGVLNIDARQTESDSTLLPVYIESISIGGQTPIPVLEAGGWTQRRLTNAPLSLRRGVSSFDVWFTALSYSTSDKLQFRHRLDGSDSDWVQDGTTRFAHYS